MRKDYVQLPAAVQQALAGVPFHLWETPSGERWLEFHRQGTHFLLRFPGIADFQVSQYGLDVTCTPALGVSDATVQHLYLNQILPLAYHAQGGLALHGSAVAIGGMALAFIGASGQGKSTLAASFASHGQPFLTDDCLMIAQRDGAYAVVPSHPSIRLWGDSEEQLMPAGAVTVLPVDYTPKSRFLAGEGFAYCVETLPLGAIYVLAGTRCQSLCIEAIKPAAALIELVRFSFQLDIEDQRGLNRHFDDVTLLCKAVPVFGLDFPRHYGDLDLVRHAIVRHAAEVMLRQ